MVQRLWGAALAVLLSVSAARSAPATVAVTEAWTRPTFGGAPNAVGYMRVVNRGPAPDRLLGGSAPWAAKLEIHRTTTVGGVARMRAVEGGVAVAGHASLVFEPNGYHLMFVAPTRAFKPGDHAVATLLFEHAGEVAVRFKVGGSPEHAMAGMAMP